MDMNRMVGVFSLVLALISVAIGIWSMEGVMIVISVLASLYSAASILYPSKGTERLAVTASVAVLICTVLLATVLSFDSVVNDGTMSKGIWMYVVAVLQTAPVVPLVVLTFMVFASVFKGSYNWAVIAGLGAFIGIGIQSIGYALVYLIQWLGLGAEVIVNGDVLYSLGIDLLVMIVFSIFLYLKFSKGIVITSDGMEDIEKVRKDAIHAENITFSAAQDLRERRTAWAMLIGCPISMMVVFAFVTAGHAPGLDAGHPVEYLQATCVLWAFITMVLPILRLLRLVSLPPWFTALVYGNMYLYVLSLCSGLYLNMSWWGDFTHILSGLIVAGFVFIALCLMQAHSPSHVTFGTRNGFLAMLFLVAMSFGGIWEMLEGFTDAVSGTAYMIYGATDTVADIAADMTGVTTMVLLAYLILSRQSAEKVASTVRLGKKAFETD